MQKKFVNTFDPNRNTIKQAFEDWEQESDLDIGTNRVPFRTKGGKEVLVTPRQMGHIHKVKRLC